ncbi:MAG: glycosyl hydrolase family 65 protein [Bacteroidota bacterium]
MRIDGEILTFNPKRWKNWNSYTVRFAYQNAIIELNVNKDKARFELIKGKENIALINKNSRLNTTKKPLSITA